LDDVCHVDIGSRIGHTYPVSSANAVEIFYEALGHRIRGARDQAGLSQLELAQRVGLARASIANLEAGRQRPPVHTIVLIASVVEVPVEALLPSLDEPPETPTDPLSALRAQASEWLSARP